MKRVGFAGGGNMAYALANAIADREDYEIHVYDPKEERQVFFTENIPRVQVHSGNTELAGESDVLFIAVKPQVIHAVLREIADYRGLLVSIAAGVSMAFIEDLVPHCRLVRVMPNTPCLVGEAASAYTAGNKVNADDLSLVSGILDAAGKAVRVDEGLMDAVTALSGSGPAFVARLIEAFTDAGENCGLDPKVARALSLQTFLGTAKLLEKKKLSPEELVDMVSSPGGTTIAGREVLEASVYHRIIGGTIEAAMRRSRELAGEEK